MRRGLGCTYTFTPDYGHAKDIETDPLTSRKQRPSVLFGKISSCNVTNVFRIYVKKKIVQHTDGTEQIRLN
jgi:hypothetical protein